MFKCESTWRHSKKVSKRASERRRARARPRFPSVASNYSHARSFIERNPKTAAKRCANRCGTLVSRCRPVAESRRTLPRSRRSSKRKPFIWRKIFAAFASEIFPLKRLRFISVVILLATRRRIVVAQCFITFGRWTRSARSRSRMRKSETTEMELFFLIKRTFCIRQLMKYCRVEHGTRLRDDRILD